MSPSTIDIELVVREVLAELQAAPQGPVAKPQAVVAPLPAEPPSEQKSSDQPFTLTVAARVVTMNDVAGRLDSIRRVVVSREAIVTPAVRDELLRRGIALTFADSSNCRPTAVRLLLMTSGTDFDPAASWRRWPARASVWNVPPRIA